MYLSSTGIVCVIVKVSSLYTVLHIEILGVIAGAVVLGVHSVYICRIACNEIVRIIYPGADIRCYII